MDVLVELAIDARFEGPDSTASTPSQQSSGADMDPRHLSQEKSVSQQTGYFCSLPDASVFAIVAVGGSRAILEVAETGN